MSSVAQKPKAAVIPWPVALLAGLVVLAALAVLGTGLDAWLSPPPPLVRLAAPVPVPSDAPGKVADLEKKASDSAAQFERLKTQLDYAEKQSDRIQRTVGVLVSIAAVFAAALGLTAYFNLKQVLESGKEDLGRLKEFRESEQAQLSKFRETILSQFPALGEMDASLTSILAKSLMVLRVTTEDWRQKVFPRVDERGKQRVAMAELKVGTFDFFSLKAVPAYAAQVREVYQLLGRYYGSKYCVARADSAKYGVPLEGDLWRAILYLESALNFAEEVPVRRAEILADLGLMTLERSYRAATDDLKKEIRGTAAERFRQSIADNPAQPAALGGLAWVQARYEGKAAAMKSLTDLITLNPNPDAETRRFVQKAYFNRACYSCSELARQGKTDAPSYSGVIEDLKNAKANVDADLWQNWLADLNNNLNSADDLLTLATVAPGDVAALKIR